MKETKQCVFCNIPLSEDNRHPIYRAFCKECGERYRLQKESAAAHRRRMQGIQTLKIDTDWEQIRVKAAIEITAALSTVTIRTYEGLDSKTYREHYDEDYLVKKAMTITDKLVSELKRSSE